MLSTHKSSVPVEIWDWKGQGPENHFTNELVGFKLRAPGLTGAAPAPKTGPGTQIPQKVFNE